MNFAVTLPALYLTLPLWNSLLAVSGTHDTARLLEVAFLIGMPLSSPESRGPLIPRWSVRLVLAWATLACLLAAVPTVAARECALLVGLVALAQQVARSPARQRLLLLRSMTCIGLLYGLIFLTTLAMALLTDGEVLPHQLVFGFDNPRHLNHTQTVLIPLALCLAATDTDRRWRMAGWLAAFLASAIAAFLMGRATLLAVALALLILTIWLRRDAIPYLKPALGSMALGTGLGFFLLSRFGASLPGQMVATGSWNNRVQLWRAALDDAGQSLWGVGPMHFSRVPRGDAAHPHNFYLQVAAEFGWPAAIALVIGVLWALIAMGKHVRRCRCRERQLYGAGLWATAIAVAIDATLSGNLVMPMSQVWGFLAIGLAIAWHREPEHPALRERAYPAKHRWAEFALLGLLVALLAVSTWEFMQADVQLLESQWRNQPRGDTFSPRFWRDGWF